MWYFVQCIQRRLKVLLYSDVIVLILTFLLTGYVSFLLSDELNPKGQIFEFINLCYILLPTNEKANKWEQQSVIVICCNKMTLLLLRRPLNFLPSIFAHRINVQALLFINSDDGFQWSMCVVRRNQIGSDVLTANLVFVLQWKWHPISEFINLVDYKRIPQDVCGKSS